MIWIHFSVKKIATSGSLGDATCDCNQEKQTALIESSPGGDPATRDQAALELRMGGFQIKRYAANSRQRLPLGQVPAHPNIYTGQ
ncbi:hypothetical protein N7501_001157 [Penicillium viridicatum]|nr:hypothetical protein N7501_001157 [Penicillium viridicatum]